MRTTRPELSFSLGKIGGGNAGDSCRTPHNVVKRHISGANSTGKHLCHAFGISGDSITIPFRRPQR